MSRIGAPLSGRGLRYAYMDHWRVDTPQGPLSQYTSVARFDAFLKQVAGVGFEAIETFDFHLPVLRDLFGSLEAARAHMQSRGIDRVLSLFHAVMYDARQSTPHVRATHDRMAGYAEYIMKSSAGLGVQNFIVMPAGLYFDVEPVTDDKIRACAELWNRIGQMTWEGYGVKTCCHHEFFCGIRSAEQLQKFYDWTDPRYVFLCLDTAQHVIAGVDPVDLFLKQRERVAAFHLKDTHHVDVNGDYRRRPDAEVMAPTTDRWFYEMGTEGGLVDFPALFGAMKDTNWQGWVGVEHDKADVGGGNYPESTAVAAWTIRNVLSPAGPLQGTQSALGGQERSDVGGRSGPSLTERQQPRWAYATNQWKAGFTGFARMEQQERALKVTAACGFDAIELSAGTGRWDPMGRPENIVQNFGSVDHFKLQLREWGIRRVASLFLDPQQMSFEELHHGLDCSERSQHALLLQQAEVFARFLAEVGGECLVLRALPPYGKHGGLNAERQAAAADCWNAVGAMTAALGVKTVLHLDALSALRSMDEVDAWLQQLDAATVGLAMDTAELTLAGHDVTAWYRRFQTRVWHIHLKDALAVDSEGEYRAPNAERALMKAGGQRGVPRWFGELGSGLVDWPALMTALRETAYAGWLVVESAQGPAPQAAAMMQNAWTVRHVLQPLLA